jgi:2,5-diamino-6-(ribosylamino)-4(3H)-pyrimidinone 5'-phosphate reductase
MKIPPRPFVSINMAMTADGKITTVNRNVLGFGSARDQTHLYELRAAADAVMCGTRTLYPNTVYLGPGPARFRRLRLKRGLAEYNLRVIVSGTGSIPSDAAIFQRRFSPIIVLTTQAAGKQRLARLRQLADDVCVCGRRELDFQRALRYLGQEWGVRRLLCEGGGELNDALFRARVVDELNLTVCPYIFGGAAAPTIAEGIGIQALAKAARLELQSHRRVRDELFLVFGVLR